MHKILHFRTWLFIILSTSTLARSQLPPVALRDCESCISSGYGWCPISRRCGLGFPAISCRSDETDVVPPSVSEVDARLKSVLQDEERQYHLAVLFFNVEKLAGATQHALEDWESASRTLSEARDVKFYQMDCARHVNVCDELLCEEDAAMAQDGVLGLFYPAGKSAGRWQCPLAQAVCERAYPTSRLLGPKHMTLTEDTPNFTSTVSFELRHERGFPLPRLEEIASDFVRVAIMRSGTGENDGLEGGLIDVAKALVAPGGVYGTYPEVEVANRFISAMQVLAATPRNARLSLMSKLGNQAASAAKSNHASLQSYVAALADHHVIQSMLRPLFE